MGSAILALFFWQHHVSFISKNKRPLMYFNFCTKALKKMDRDKNVPSAQKCLNTRPTFNVE
jgi:hypothetical protein